MNFTRVDALCLSDHHWLTPDDECYFLREYTAGKGYAHSETNDLILNLKKPPDRRDKLAEWRHKQTAIRTAAKEFREGLNPKWLAQATLVPIPPHRIKADPGYDERMTTVLRTMGSYDVRELVVQRENREPAHGGSPRPTPLGLRNSYNVDESVAFPEPKLLGIVDDVLTTGCQFKAIQGLLAKRYAGVSIVGLFWARRVPAQDESPEG